MMVSLLPSLKWGHKTSLLQRSQAAASDFVDGASFSVETWGHKVLKHVQIFLTIRVCSAPEFGWQQSDARFDDWGHYQNAFGSWALQGEGRQKEISYICSVHGSDLEAEVYLLIYLQIVYTCCSIKYTHRASFKIMRVKIKMEWKLIFSCCTPLGHFVFLLGYPIPLRRFLGWDGVVEGERCIRVVIPEAEGEGIESQKPLPSADSTVYLSRPAVPVLGRPGAGDSAHAWRK